MGLSDSLVLGLDFGTDSARGMLIDAQTGEELAISVKDYTRWNKELYCDPAKYQFRHHPLDYIEALEYIVPDVLSKVPGSAKVVKAIGLTATGSTPVTVDEEGTPLALKAEFAGNPNAMFVLWKDHTAQAACSHINAFSKKYATDYTRSALCGDYSVEHFWGKVLHLLQDPIIKEAAYSFVEACDWLSAELTGNIKPEKLKRGISTASSRAMWNKDWGGYPPNEYFKALDPALDGIINTFNSEAYSCDQPVGTLNSKWARRFGLSEHVTVSVGGLDCHIGAIGAGVKAGAMVEIIGTSTCAITVAPKTEKASEISGVPQQADGMILPGMVGYESGQSCFGDLYKWFKNILMWPLHQVLAYIDMINTETKERLIERMHANIIPMLDRQAKAIPPQEGLTIASDWINGRRSPNVDYDLKGTITGLTLSSTAPIIYKSLVEATAYGAKAIIEQFQQNGGELKEVIAVGGISHKSPYVMQVLADVLGMPIQVVATRQACALGAAMCAAVAAGIYPKMAAAQRAMQAGKLNTYLPNPENRSHYCQEYKKYQKLEALKELTA